MRVVGYVRVSTDEQAEEGYSIAEQTETIQKWCKDNGHPPAVIIVDDGYSAKDLRRPGIKKSMDAIQQKQFDIAVTTKLNRLSRKLLDILSLVEFFDKNNCNYVSVRESFDTSTYVGRMQMQMLGVIAEFDRERIAEDVRNTMRSVARKSGESKKAFTVPSFGYDVVDGIYKVNLQEALAIEKMAEWIISGMGCRSVAQRLNSPPYMLTGKLGGTWSETSVRQLVRRETLKGQLVYNRTYKKNRKTFTRPPEEWIIIEDHHPAILDERTWDDLQRAMDGRKVTNKHADNERWLLTGLLKCAHCGANMTGKALTKSKYPDYIGLRYVCSSYQKKGECFHHMVERDGLENSIIDTLREISTAFNTKHLQLATAEPKSVTNEKETLTSRLSKLDSKMQKQLEAYEEELISAADLKRARERVDVERHSIEQALTELEQDTGGIDNKAIVQHIKRFAADLVSGDRLKIKNAIRQMIQKIVITNGTDAEILYHSG